MHRPVKPVRARPITLLYVMGFKNNLAQIIIMTNNMSRIRSISLGQRSRSQSALKLCAQTSVKPVRVQPITLLCMMGFEKNFAQIIIRTRQCVANKNHVARLKVKVTVSTKILCIDFNETCSSPTNNFVMHCEI